MAEGKSEAFQSASDHIDQACTDVSFFNRDPYKFVTTHNNAIKIWTFNPNSKKLTHFDCPLGHIKRHINCVSVDKTDALAYCGTRSGDILEIALARGIYNRSGPTDKKFKSGVNQVISKFNHLYVGTKDGTFAKIDKKGLCTSGEVNLENCSLTTLSASNSKVYCVSNRSIVRSVSDEGSI